MSEWRERLRQAVERSGRDRSAIARRAGVARETVSRVLTGRMRRASFETVVRITHAAGERVGWLLGERGFNLDAEERAALRQLGEKLIAAADDGPL